MSRLVPASGLTRRRFCQNATLGLAAVGLTACVGDGRVTMGGLDGEPGTGSGGGGGSTDLGSGGGGGGGSTDMAHSGGGGGSTDMAHGGGGGNTCSTGSGIVNAGNTSTIPVGTYKLVSSSFYVCHDSGGIYAMDAACPHAGCNVKKQTSQFYCPCHGATFDLNGQHPTSPAFSPLPHFSVCIDGSGNIMVDTNTEVPYTTRA